MIWGQFWPALSFVFLLLSRQYRRVLQDITTATAGARRSLPGNGREREQRGDREGGRAITAEPIRLEGATTAMFQSDTLSLSVTHTPTLLHPSSVIIATPRALSTSQMQGLPAIHDEPLIIINN